MSKRNNGDSHFTAMERRVFYSFSLLVVLILAILTLVFYWEYRNQLRQDVRARLHDIVAVAALQIDAESHNTLRKPEQEGNETYLRLRRDLQKIRDAATGIRYVYTMVPGPDNDIMFVLDAESTIDK